MSLNKQANSINPSLGSTRRRPIAIFINGGIGVGLGLEGSTWLTEFCEKVAEKHPLTVFTLEEANPNYHPKGYRFVGTGLKRERSLVIRVLVLFTKVLFFHIRFNFQVFHGFWGFAGGTLAVVLGKLLHRKSIVTFIGSEFFEHPVWVQKMIRFTAKNTDLLIAQTHNHAQKIRKAVDFKRLEVVSFGVDLGKFPASIKTPTPPYQFLYLGNISPVKDLLTLIKTFQLISEQVPAQLDIVGLDTMNGQIQQVVEVLDLSQKVRCRGVCLYREISDYLQKAHFLLHTSRSEGQALVVNEALASGVVVCGTRVGILDDLDGKITSAVAIGDYESLAHKVLELIKNPAKYAELQAKGIAWSKENDLEAQMKKYMTLY